MKLAFILFFLTLGYSYAKIDRKTCGKFPEEVIVGGKEATRSYPWMVSVRGVKNDAEYCTRGNPCCGGTILSERWVITAAHCVLYGLKDLYIYYGLTYFDGRDGSKYVQASKVFVHARYKSDENYDIALIKTASPMKFGSKVASICLPSKNSLPSGRAYSIGWGYTTMDDDHGGRIAKKLKEAKNRILPKEECVIKSNVTLCCDARGATICYGDSGGPLFQLDDSGKPTIIGIASRVSDETCKPGSQSTFTKVSSFLKWIEIVTD